jgi:hypothetical protein
MAVRLGPARAVRAGTAQTKPPERHGAITPPTSQSKAGMPWFRFHRAVHACRDSSRGLT